MTSVSKYQHLLLPEMNSRRASTDKQSIQETPLPPLPGKDPIYEEVLETMSRIQNINNF